MRKLAGGFVAGIAALYALVAGYLWVVDHAAGSKTLRLGVILFSIGAIGAGILAWWLLR